MKHCASCDKDKRYSEFYTSKQKSDGLCTRCKVCERARKNKAYATNPDFRRAVLARVAKYNRTNYSGPTLFTPALSRVFRTREAA